MAQDSKRHASERLQDRMKTGFCDLLKSIGVCNDATSATPSPRSPVRGIWEREVSPQPTERTNNTCIYLGSAAEAAAFK